MADFWLLQPAELKFVFFFPHTKRTQYYLSLAPEMGLSKEIENQSYILFWVNEGDKSRVSTVSFSRERCRGMFAPQ